MPKTTATTDLQFSGNEVIIRIPKAIIILTRAQLKEALRRGRAYRRREQLAQRMAKVATESLT